MPLLPLIVDRLTDLDPRCAEEVQACIRGADALYQERAESFFGRYDAFIQGTGRSFDFGIQCFLKLRESMNEERLHFLRTGAYSSKSFAEVNERVYGNPETMQYHMHGLVLAQFLWPDQYRRFSFFSEHLPTYQDGIRKYLEVGSGHGLYLMEAMRVLGPDAIFDAVDISPSSMELVRGMALPAAAQFEADVRFHLQDIFDVQETELYDFITMGEVLEHVEQPFELLRRLHELLAPDGHAYITTPANAPTRDHIFLFNNAAEIRDMFRSAGFAIEREVAYYASNAPAKKAERLKLPLMFGAFLRKA